MNVSYSDSVTNTVKNLRETVYCTDAFKESFSTALESSIGAIDTSFVPEQFGGWSVNATINRSLGHDLGIEEQTSTSYLNKVSTALVSAIHSTDSSAACSDSVVNNLVNVVVTGHDSLTVKL